MSVSNLLYNSYIKPIFIIYITSVICILWCLIRIQAQSCLQVVAELPSLVLVCQTIASNNTWVWVSKDRMYF